MRKLAALLLMFLSLPAMATIQYIPGAAGQLVMFGLSSDTKPEIANGHVFVETDTAKIFVRSGGAWAEVTNAAYQPADADLTDLADGTLGESKIDSAITRDAEAAAAYQPLEATLTDIADGTIAEDLVNTANPWADNEVSDTLTASVSSTAAANDNDTSIATTAFVQQEIDDGDLLTDNCVLENDATPIPDSCVGDGSDAGGGSGPTILGANVDCAVNASYCTIFTISGGGISASRGLYIEGHLNVDTNSTTVAAQFRVSSADAGYTGNCQWIAPESTTATTAPATDIVAIGSAPGDTAGTTWFSTAPVPVQFHCALLSDGSPGDIVVEFQLETGTSTQTVLRGSYYTLVQ